MSITRTGISRTIKGLDPIKEENTLIQKVQIPKEWQEIDPRKYPESKWCQVEEACADGVLPRFVQQSLKTIN